MFRRVQMSEHDLTNFIRPKCYGSINQSYPPDPNLPEIEYLIDSKI